MPFVEGESLRDRLQREKQLPIHDAVRLAGEVAAALDYAHHRGVIHRDIRAASCSTSPMVTAKVQGGADFQVTGREMLFSTRPFAFTPWHQAFGVAPDDRSFIMLQQAAEPGSGDARRLVVVLNWLTYVRARAGPAGSTGRSGHCPLGRVAARQAGSHD